MLTMWNGYMVNYFEQIQTQSENIGEAQEACMLSSKVLKKFMVHGFKEFGPDSQPMVIDVIHKDKFKEERANTYT
ncbi:Hypothetical predicted protein [Paramuricea clavata]|uniref:Uncharacterized protein n=2 Tax=Paramuricea clavata TaxID=317549 RepID=A0A7D9MEY1_PARCT|nr:Hypothetical predicted protein [Paramuricea clavata]